jgi:hypothetical protein
MRDFPDGLPVEGTTGKMPLKWKIVTMRVTGEAVAGGGYHQVYETSSDGNASCKPLVTARYQPTWSRTRTRAGGA